MPKKKKRSIVKFLLSLDEVENKLRRASKISNRNKLKGWSTKNILIPVLLVFAPFIFGLFVPAFNISLKEIIFNGGLTIIGVSVLYSASSYLVRTKINFEEHLSEFHKKQKIGDSLSSLRAKVLDRTHFVVLVSAIIYFVQIAYMSGKEQINENANADFNNTDYILVLLIVCFLMISISFGKLIFELSDEIIDERDSYEAIYSLIEEQEVETKELVNKLMKEL